MISLRVLIVYDIYTFGCFAFTDPYTLHYNGDIGALFLRQERSKLSASLESHDVLPEKLATTCEDNG